MGKKVLNLQETLKIKKCNKNKLIYEAKRIYMYIKNIYLSATIITIDHYVCTTKG